MGWLSFGRGTARRDQTDDRQYGQAAEQAKDEVAELTGPARRVGPTATEATDGTAALQLSDRQRRRGYSRISGSDLNHIDASLDSGTRVHLIDLSRSGVHFECIHGFLPNATITLQLMTPDGAFVAAGRVVRSRLVQLQRGGVGYSIALYFQNLLAPVAIKPIRPVDRSEPEADETPAPRALTLVEEVVEPDAADPDDALAAVEAVGVDGDVVLAAPANRASYEPLERLDGNTW